MHRLIEVCYVWEGDSGLENKIHSSNSSERNIFTTFEPADVGIHFARVALAGYPLPMNNNIPGISTSNLPALQDVRDNARINNDIWNAAAPALEEACDNNTENAHMNNGVQNSTELAGTSISSISGRRMIFNYAHNYYLEQRASVYKHNEILDHYNLTELVGTISYSVNRTTKTHVIW